MVTKILPREKTYGSVRLSVRSVRLVFNAHDETMGLPKSTGNNKMTQNFAPETAVTKSTVSCGTKVQGERLFNERVWLRAGNTQRKMVDA